MQTYDITYWMNGLVIKRVYATNIITALDMIESIYKDNIIRIETIPNKIE